MRISEFSKKVSLTKRTLQYYDEIGLLLPEKKENGYREYNDTHFEIVENIKFLRELDYSLEEIKFLLENGLDKDFLLEKQINYLEDQITIIREKITMLKDTKAGGIRMDVNDIKKKYQKEVEERWGQTNEYKESKRKTSKYTKHDWDKIMKEQSEIYSKMSEFESIEDEEVGLLVNEWQSHISKYYYTCTDEILLGLADMYVADQRFKDNLDKTKAGFAEFLSDAIRFHKLK